MSVKSKAQILIDIATFFPDNTSEQVSAADERNEFIDIVESFLNEGDFFTGSSAYCVAADGSFQLIPVVPTVVSDVAYDATTWNGVTTIAPSKNAVRDKIEAIITSLLDLYALDGSRPLTGDMDAGGFDLKHLSEITDVNDDVSVDILNRHLKHSTGQIIFDYEDGFIYDYGGGLFLDTNYFTAHGPSGIVSMRFYERRAMDSANLISIDWNNRTLHDDLDDPLVDWSSPSDGVVYVNALTFGSNDRSIPDVGYVKAYADALVVGLWDDRGSFDASVNAYPSSGGSGTAGAILKGDIWTISVAGTLPTGLVVESGDTVRALVDTPGNTQANWSILQNNIGYTPVTNTRTLTINGTGHDLSADRSWTVGDALVANSLAQFASTTSLQLKTLISDETGSGSLVFADTPTLITPILGVASAASIAMSSFINEAKGADIASAATTDIGAAAGNYINVTGTTTITNLGTVQAGTRRVVNFTGILLLTYNATSLILPTSSNITTAAGDVAVFISLGSGNWKCVSYTRASGAALVGSAGLTPLSRTIESPSSSEKIFLGYSTAGTTISKISAVLPGGAGSPSVTYTVVYGTDISAAGTKVVTAGSTVTSITSVTSVTSFDQATIPAGNMFWLITTAKSGSVPQWGITIEFSA